MSNGSTLVINGDQKATINAGSGQSNFEEPKSSVEVGQTGGRPSMPVSFLDDVLDYKSARTLSADGTEFIKALTEMQKQKNVVVEVLPRTNCYLFHDNSYSVGVMFEEHMPFQRDLLPRTRFFDQAYKEAEERFSQYPVATIVLCSATDYDRVAQWDKYITRVLRCGIQGSASFELSSIVNNNLFRITTSKHAVDQVVNDLCIHGVLPYYQYGVVLEMCTEPNVRRDYRYNRNLDDFNWSPIMVIPAYTGFITNNSYSQQNLKFVPQIHISEPLCLFPNIKMLPLVLAISMQYFIVEQMWKDQFNQFDQVNPNIGNLWFDPETNEPAFVRDVRERESFISDRCTDPHLVLDIQNGRAGIAGYSLLAINEFQELFLTQFEEFFNNDEFRDFNSVIGSQSQEYTGVVTIEGKTYDSRYFDYFRVIKSCNNQHDLLDRFISLPVNGDEKLNALVAMNYSVQSLYDASMCIVDPNLLLLVAGTIGSKFPLLNQGGSNGRYIDFSSINYASKTLAEGIAARNGNFFTSGNNGRNGYNPFMRGYRTFRR